MNHKKNVWIINQFAGTSTSGWGERHFYFSKNWIEKGYTINIISGSYNHVFSELPHAPHQFNIQIVEKTKFCWVKTPKYNPKSFGRFWSFLVFAFKVFFAPVKELGKPDIILVSSMPIFPIFTGYLLKKRYKANQLIFEIRDIWPLTLVMLGDVSKNHPAVRFIGWFEKFGYKKSDHIVSLLPNAAKHIKEVSNCEHKFTYIPNGLDTNVLKREELPKEMIESIPKNKFIIGYTGTIGLANALEYLIDAAELLKDDPKFHFVIIGDGYLKKELFEKSKNFGNVSFFNKIKKNQVASALDYFNICFVGRNDSPLFQHGVSANKYFDYMLASKPILDSNNFIKDPVELSGCGLIVKPDSAIAIKEGIIELYNKTQFELIELGRKGRDYVNIYHNITNLSNQYIQIFESKN
jgi:glycosyltransferase involved in cell wall biosynthesis